MAQKEQKGNGELEDQEKYFRHEKEDWFLNNN